MSDGVDSVTESPILFTQMPEFVDHIRLIDGARNEECGASVAVVADGTIRCLLTRGLLTIN